MELFKLRLTGRLQEPQKVYLDDEDGIYRDWYNQNYMETEAPEFPKCLLGIWGKINGHAARIALILHLCKVVTENANYEAVSSDTIREAIAIAEYFKDHAKKVHGVLGDNNFNRTDQKVIEWMSKHNRDTVTPRELQTAKVAGITKADKAREVLYNLQECGMGILVKNQNIFIKF